MSGIGDQVSIFPHGVASGDPDVDSAVIWTRVAAGGADGETESVGAPRPVRWFVARNPDMTGIVSSGDAVARAEDNFTVQVDVGGLEPDAHYWYAFERGGERSPVGRLRTLPGPGVDHLRFAVVSCAKYNSGFFNGYARMAERDDLNFVLHLGDYIYEASQKPPASQTPGADIGRPFDPFNECVTLDDYRRRYAQYRMDPDTQALHHAHSLLATLDDHEFADGAWRGGADEHKPERDGPWETRREAAFQARREWLPQRLPDPRQPDRVFRTVAFGDLADLFLIDTRSRRDQPVAGPLMNDPARSQLGAEQRQWLFKGLAGSKSAWRLLANSSVLSRTWAPGIPEDLRNSLRWLKLVNADGGPDPDQWDGYPVERNLLLDQLDGRNVVVLSGDVHVAMAIELEHEDRPGKPIATEFVTASLTSQNLDDKTGWGYRTQSVDAEKELVEYLPNILWCDMDSHGYLVVDVTPDRVRVEFWFVDAILERTDGEHLAAAMEVRSGSQRIVPTT
jgi:alkaline phosphatase D